MSFALVFLLAMWVLIALMVLGACRVAAHGDAAVRRGTSHWGRLPR